VPKLPSYLEDTRHLLAIIEEINAKSTQPAGAIPVVMDITNMYVNIPWDERIIAFEEAIADRENTDIHIYLMQCSLYSYLVLLWEQK